jgi:AraC-like DNA-binding protein
MVGAIPAVAAALSVFLLLVLLSKGPLTGADRWLGLWFSGQAVFFGSTVIASTPLSDSASLWLLLVAQCCLFVLGPAQYLYAVTALDAPRHYRWHFAYIAVSLLLLANVALGLEIRVESGALIADQVPRWIGGVLFCVLLIPALYPTAIFRLTSRYRSGLEEQLSSFGASDVGWLRIWAGTSLAATLALALVVIAATVGGWPVEIQVAASFVLQTASLAYAGYHGLTRPGVFLPYASAARTPPKQSVDTAEAVADFGAVERLLEKEKPYLDPALTARALADRLGWAPDRLTSALRNGGKTSFFDAINAGRVREVQRLAAEPRNARISLLALAHDAGFGSKSAFYEAFQRHEGCSPAAWRRNDLLRKA